MEKGRSSAWVYTGAQNSNVLVAFYVAACGQKLKIYFLDEYKRPYATGAKDYVGLFYAGTIVDHHTCDSSV